MIHGITGVMANVKTSRPYSSPRRERAARATRQAVLDAARDLFVANGYTATTIDEIAAVAEVSRPTVFSVGTKAELLKLVRDIAIAGDDEAVAVPDREPVAEMRAAPDPATTLRLHARNVVRINARYAEIDEVLHQAAGAHPELRQLWEASEQQRLTGATLVIDDVLRKGSLKPALAREQAIDVLWLLMAPGHLLRMRQRGWNDTAYEAWLAETLVVQLLPR